MIFIFDQIIKTNNLKIFYFWFKFSSCNEFEYIKKHQKMTNDVGTLKKNN